MKGSLAIRAVALPAAVLAMWPVDAAAQVPAAGPARMTLEQFEQIALSDNPTLAQAAAEVRAATGREQQAGLYPNPTVGYEGEEIRGGEIRGGQQGFFVSQNIVLGGKLGLSRRVFEQELRQAEVEADEQRLRVLSNVRRLYAQALAAQRVVELRRELSRLSQQAVGTSRQLLNVGQADLPDQLAAEVEAEQVELELTQAEQNQQRIWKSLTAVVGRPEMPLVTLDGNLEEPPAISTDELLETLLRESPAVKIAVLSVSRADAVIASARRTPVPDIQLRGGLQQNRELLGATGRPVGLQGFAQIGVTIPIFNRNQGSIAAAVAERERAEEEVRRIDLLLRARFAGFAQSYLTSKAAVDRYRDEMIPRARRAYEMYLARYQAMGAAYPQVLIAQRTYFQLQTKYVAALENLWTTALAMQSFLLMDGLEAPSRPREMDMPVRELNVPLGTGIQQQE